MTQNQRSKLFSVKEQIIIDLTEIKLKKNSVFETKSSIKLVSLWNVNERSLLTEIEEEEVLSFGSIQRKNFQLNKYMNFLYGLRYFDSLHGNCCLWHGTQQLQQQLPTEYIIKFLLIGWFESDNKHQKQRSKSGTLINHINFLRQIDFYLCFAAWARL